MKHHSYFVIIIFTDSEKRCDSGALDQLSADPTSHLIQLENNQLHCESLNPVSAPPLCNLDVGVIGSLPPELFSELNEIYGGKLDDLLAKSRYKSEAFLSSLRVSSQGPVEGEIYLWNSLLSGFCN